MSPQDMLYRRAVRMLNDGRRHAPQALRWARAFTHVFQRRSVREMQQAGFSLHEISLGVGEVVR